MSHTEPFAPPHLRRARSPYVCEQDKRCVGDGDMPGWTRADLEREETKEDKRQQMGGHFGSLSL